MERDSKDLGRLRRVADPRDVWLTEAGDFTPWLAENIDVLADELGMTLTVTAMEVPVGEFRLDIQCADDEGHVVVIENQLERTDHSHLGQCLVYAAGLEATTVIWVSRLFRDEFRRAFDWLNERTDLGVKFFGIEVGVVQIGDDGPRAPVFEVVSRPNNWQKGIKPTPPPISTPLNEARQGLFAEILEGVNAKRPAIRVPARSRDSWTTFASGPFGSWSMAQINDGRIRVEAYLDCGDRDRNKTLFDELEGDRANWEEKVGFNLSFERLDDKRACRIAAHHPAVDLLAEVDSAQRAQVVDWGVASMVAMIDALNVHLRERAKDLRGKIQPSRSFRDDVDAGEPAPDAESQIVGRLSGDGG